MPARALPAMEDTMKQEKIMPCGRVSPRAESAGVHRKTKVYMEPSNSDCIAPSMAILGSAYHPIISCIFPTDFLNQIQINPSDKPTISPSNVTPVHG